MAYAERPRRGRKRSVAAATVLLATLLLLSLAGATAPSPRSANRESAGPLESKAPGPAVPTAPLLAHPDVPLPASATVDRSVLVNYNATWPGNFLSSVDDLSVGPGAFVPATGELWLSDLPKADVPGTLPGYAPAILFNPATNSFAGIVPQLTNTSDLLFDPANGLLYSADSLANSVGVFDPVNDDWAAPSIPVGSEPVALALDLATGDLFVANYGSSNVTVISTATNTVSVPSIASGSEPFGLAIDPLNQTLYVACANSFFLTLINATTFVTPASPTFSMGADPAGVAYSPETGAVAASVPGRSLVAVFNVTNGAPTTIHVGAGVGAIEALPTNSDFVVANSLGSNLVTVDPVSGTIVNSSIPVGEGPRFLMVDGTDATVYAWSMVSRSLTLVWNDAAPASLASPSLGPTPVALAYDPSAARILVANSNDSTISFLSPSSLETVAPPLQLASPPLSLADDPTDNVVYAGLDTGLVTINPATATMVATNSAFTGATEALFVDTPDHILWALNSLHGLVGYELPGLSTTLTAGIGAGQTGIRTLAFDPTTDELFLPVNTSGTSEIAVVDASTGTVVSADLLSAPDLASLAYDPVDGSVYALGQNISIINASTLTLDFVPLPIAPHVGAGTIVYDASRGYLFASTWTAADSGTLTEIDGQSVDAAFAGETVMGVGHSPVAVLPIEVPGSSPSVPSEVWVANSLAGTLSIVANSPPQIVAFSALPGTVDPGENTTFVLTVTGGAGPVDISYAGLPSGCASTNTSRLNCTPESAGTYTVTATVTDGLGNSAQANTTLVVDEGLAVHLFEATNTFPEVELGTELIVGVDPTGGAAPYTYAWSFGDGTYGSGPIIEHLYGARGSYLLQVNATDGVGGRASLVWGIDVFAPPTLKGTASSLSTDVGVPVVLTAAPQGGWGNGTTVWSFGDGTGASGTRVTHDWTARGVYDVTVNYTDALGDRTNWSTQVRVNDSPSGTFLVLAATGAAPGEPGTLFYYNATLSGGTGPFTVTWHFGDGSEAVGLLVTHSYGAAGNYSVTVNATDAVGGSVAASLAVEVVAPSPASGGPTLSFSLGILLGLVVGAALAAVAVFEATRRRGRGRTPPPPPSPYVPPAPHQAWKED